MFISYFCINEKHHKTSFIDKESRFFYYKILVSGKTFLSNSL